MDSKKRDSIIFYLLLIIQFVLIGMYYYVTRNQSDLTLGGLVLHNSGFIGVITGLISLTSVLLVCADNSNGRILSMTSVMVVFLDSILSIIVQNILSPLPGLINMIFSLTSLIIISSNLDRINKNSWTELVTGLYNRRGFVTNFNRKYSKTGTMVAHIRVRNLRAISDELGLEYGEIALKIVADRIKSVVGEQGIIAKLDGMEFAVAVPKEIGTPEFFNKLIEELQKKIIIRKEEVKNEYYLRIYVGVASYPDNSSDIKTLMKYAGAAMYYASKEKKGLIKFYDEEINQKITRTLQVESMIKNALEKDLFYLVYQPQYSAGSKTLRGFETLIRLKDEEGNTISPSEFISIAEKSELILAIDEYVLEKAMHEFAGVVNSNNMITLSINVSAKSIALENFADMVLRIVKKNAFIPQNLEIEITEYSITEYGGQAVANINKLRKNGIKFALDDFGTGYTSLSQLLNVPVDILKIDKTLIDDIENNKKNRDFIQAVINMGHLMKCEVISEGVEGDSQLRLLKNQDCDYIQGYVWSRPVDYQKAVEIINEQ